MKYKEDTLGPGKRIGIWCYLQISSEKSMTGLWNWRNLKVLNPMDKQKINKCTSGNLLTKDHGGIRLQILPCTSVNNVKA